MFSSDSPRGELPRSIERAKLGMAIVGAMMDSTDEEKAIAAMRSPVGNTRE
jgi:hypothetical protein